MVSGFFVLHAWRWTIFRGWLVPFPDLNGTWIGNIQTTWTDPTSGKVLPPVPAILTIRQSFIHINCVVRTEEMTSHSYLASFWLDGDEQIRKLGYSYHSSTRPTVQDRSVPHDGTMVMELLGNPVRRLSGVYWTTRRTTGEAQFDFHSKERLDELPASLAKHPMGLTP
jgi:hypothetical protein